ncbi:dynein regulatory complex subunit 5 isoform X1 [Anguilla rostrata]|uniref:dynein regulatory complex subunit 5 isoform X1 n=1 Tax=Anguilla rostrata TaxID=7938 RepID=UPI0030D139D9
MCDTKEGSGRPLQMSPPLANQNPAADSRKMRRIIAEDPEWSLATVPLLTNLCLTHIIQNFEENPILEQLLPAHKAYVHARLSTALPLRVTANLISDEGYWQRCCECRWALNNASAYGGSWKRMFLERHLQGLIELFIPDVTDPAAVLEAVPHCRGFVRRLDVSQLLPPIRQPRAREEDEDEASDGGYDGPSLDHFDFSALLPQLQNLEELHVVYRVSGCGMNFEWNLFEFTSRDCHSLAKALKSCKTLKVVRVHQSKVDDERCQVLVRSLLDHPALQELDLSHNLIGDRGAKAVGKLLGRCRLQRLTLCDNRIRGPGGQALAHALAKTSTLTALNLRLNFLGDEGGQAVAHALLKNRSLVTVHLGANQMTEPTAMVLSQVLAQNSVLRDINLSCNRLGVDGGKALEEGMSHNCSVLECDVRLTDMGQESEFSINQILQNNRNKARTKPLYQLHSP